MSAPAFNPAKFLPSAAYRKAGIMVVAEYLPGTSAATSGNFDHFFIAPYKCEVVSFDAVWSAASTSGTLMLEKRTGTQAKAAGTNILTGTIDLSAAANTVVNGVISTTRATVQLATGDRLGVSDGGTLTSQANLCWTVVLVPITATS